MTEADRRYVVNWRSRQGNSSGEGALRMSREEAEGFREMLDMEYREMEHFVEEVTNDEDQ